VRFHVLLAVRDEADVISQSLEHLLTWADAVYVFDTGSLDETWEIIQRFASKDNRVVPLAHDSVFFSEKRLRGWMFNQVRRHMRAGDWFVRADADEFYHVAPPEFVRTRMNSYETIAYHQYYDFRLTSEEVEVWEQGIETLADRTRPIEERRRWFTVSSYSEPRMCRYRESMQWPETVSFPYNAGYVARERLSIRHYPHRDPVQLERRCRIRSTMMAEPENACNRHWRDVDWRAHIAGGETPVHYWAPGTELPEPRFTNHLAPWPKRLAQRVVHAWLLSVMDKFRTPYSEGTYLRPLPAALKNRLAAELGTPRVTPMRGDL
jgi:glycosyltransferase involved in cell wall biosynthesis